MTLQELQNAIKSKIFINEVGTTFRFILENTLRINEDPSMISHYEIYEENSKFYLKHNGLLGSDDVEIDILNEEPLTITLTERFTRKNKHATLRQ